MRDIELYTALWCRARDKFLADDELIALTDMSLEHGHMLVHYFLRLALRIRSWQLAQKDFKRSWCWNWHLSDGFQNSCYFAVMPVRPYLTNCRLGYVMVSDHVNVRASRYVPILPTTHTPFDSLPLFCPPVENSWVCSSLRRGRGPSLNNRWDFITDQLVPSFISGCLLDFFESLPEALPANGDKPDILKTVLDKWTEVIASRRL